MLAESGRVGPVDFLRCLTWVKEKWHIFEAALKSLTESLEMSARDLRSTEIVMPVELPLSAPSVSAASMPQKRTAVPLNRASASKVPARSGVTGRQRGRTVARERGK